MADFQATKDGMVEKGAEQPKVQDVTPPTAAPEESTLGPASSDAPASTTVSETPAPEATTANGDPGMEPEKQEATPEPEAPAEAPKAEEGEAKAEEGGEAAA